MADLDIGAFDAAFADVTTVAAVSAAIKTPYIDPKNLKLFKRRLKLPSWYNPSWEVGSEGLERDLVLDESLIFKNGGCGALREALVTGGEHDDNPRWHIKLMAASFLKDPRPLAHAMGNKHHKYTLGDTEAEMDRIDADKKSRVGGMGWPGCDKFEGFGCTECALCPHRGQIRSPLNLAVVKHELKPGEQPAETVSEVTYAGNEILPGFPKYVLPDHYAFNAAGYVCLMVTKKEKTADGIEVHNELIPLLDKQFILDPRVQQEPDAIIFWVNGSKGEPLREVMLERGIGTSSPQSSLDRLGSQGVAPNNDIKNKVGDFFMSLLRKIEDIRASVKARPFGWIHDKGMQYSGFVYGKTFHRNGTESPSGYIDDKMRHNHAPVGKIEPWVDASRILVEDAIMRDRIAYVAFLATAFAGPLMAFTALPLVWFHLPGESGCGKSTILKLIAACWGHPEHSRLIYDPTLYSAANKMGTLANIPICFDEITDDAALGNALTVNMMDGSDRERMGSSHGRVFTRETKHWQTILCSTGNRSALDFVAIRQKDINMGRRRVFELPWVPAGDNQRMERVDVDELIKSLRWNYGQVGLVYSKFIASKGGELNQLVAARSRAFDTLVGATQEERFWSTLCAVLLLGAEFARDLGLVPFDIPMLEAYLVKCFNEQRAKLKSSDQDGMSPAVEMLGAFLKEHYHHTIVTDELPRRGGTPGSMPFKILKAPKLEFFKGIYVQWVARAQDPIVRISRKALEDWLVKNKHQPGIIFNRIKHVTTQKVSLAGKTPFAGAPERCMEISIQPGTWMASLLADITGTEDTTMPLTPETLAATDEDAILAAAASAKQKDQAHVDKTGE